MSAPAGQPLRIALAPGTAPDAGRRRALAALLLRAGLPVTAGASPDRAGIVLAGEGSVPPDADIPTLLLPAPTLTRAQRKPFRSALRSFLRAVTRTREITPDFLAERVTESVWRLRFDLPGLTQGLLEGWEEDGTLPDDHDRFDPEASELTKADVLDRPVLDEAARALGALLARLAGLPPPPKPGWTFCATLDIDSAGMFRGWSALRNLAAIASRNPRRLIEAAGLCLRVKLRAAWDPQVRLRDIAEALEGMGVPAVFFSQTHRRHRLDNYRLDYARELLRALQYIGEGGYHAIGLHSSYATRNAPDTMFFRAQWRRLRRLVPEGVEALHRAHYLRMPDELEYPEAGQDIRLVDSSLGFGSREGFRRSTCHPFIPRQELVEVAPCVMDTTLRHFRSLTPEQAHRRILTLMDRVRAVGGVFVPIWHPNNMEPFLWPGWTEVWYDMLAAAKSRGARFQSLAHAARDYEDRADSLERQLNALPP